MAYERNWAFSFNNRYGPTSLSDMGRWTLWSIKALLCGQLGGLTLGLWQVYSSSDSITAGNGDGPAVDRWGSTYDGTKIVRGSGGAPFSWVVLKSPLMNGFNWYLTIAYSGTLDYTCAMNMSKTAPSAGSITAVPSSVAQWDVMAGATSFTYSALTTLVQSNICLSSTGDFIWFANTPPVGGTGAATILCAIAPVGCHASDNYPIWNYFEYSGAGALQGFGYPGLQGNSGTGSCRTLLSNGSTGGAQLPLVAAPSASYGFMTGGQLDVLSGLVPTFPAYVTVSNNFQVWHSRGRLPDIFVVPTGNTAATSHVGRAILDVSGDVTHVCIGGALFIPANAVPALRM